MYVLHDNCSFYLKVMHFYYIGVCVVPGSHGVHLEMSRKNRGALRFYKKLGFVAVELEGAESGSSPSDDVLILGKRLSSGH